MRSNQGGELTSKEFKEFFEAEKKRTIFDMTRSMLKSKKLHKEFWAKAIACTIIYPTYLQQEVYGARHHKTYSVADCQASFI